MEGTLTGNVHCPVSYFNLNENSTKFTGELVWALFLLFNNSSSTVLNDNQD